MVRGLAVEDGTTICATIHSPSSACFALFDRVMVLASGWTVYFGAPGEAVGGVGEVGEVGRLGGWGGGWVGGWGNGGDEATEWGGGNGVVGYWLGWGVARMFGKAVQDALKTADGGGCKYQPKLNQMEGVRRLGGHWVGEEWRGRWEWKEWKRREGTGRSWKQWKRFEGRGGSRMRMSEGHWMTPAWYCTRIPEQGAWERDAKDWNIT